MVGLVSGLRRRMFLGPLLAVGMTHFAIALQIPVAPPLEILQVASDVYVIVGSGGNITVNVGSQGLLVVDSGSDTMSDQTVTAIRRISSLPIRYLINTNADADHTGGNPALNKIGAAIPTRELLEKGAVVIAHEQVLKRMSAPKGQQSPTPIAAWPTSTFFVPRRDIYFNNQPVQLLHQPAAHTDGDVIVLLRKSDVLAVGDIFDKTRFPVVDLARGGSLTGLIEGLNTVLDLAVSGEKTEGGTMVIPGHGRVCDEADVVDYRDMVTIVRDRIQDLANKGMTLEQVKAARPTRDFDHAYGPSERFVESVYRSLVGKK